MAKLRPGATQPSLHTVTIRLSEEELFMLERVVSSYRKKDTNENKTTLLRKMIRNAFKRLAPDDVAP
jgi:hypothetical protein